MTDRGDATGVWPDGQDVVVTGQTTGSTVGQSDQSDQGKAAEVKEQFKATTSTAAAKTSEVAGTATEGAKQVASEASTQAAQLAREASAHAREVAGQAGGQLKDQASQQTERAAQGLRSLSTQVQALADGRPEEAGAVGDYARQAQQRLAQVAERLEDGGLDGLLEDAQRFARRRPGLFLVGAGAAGFAVGRMLRGAQAASQNASEDNLHSGQPYMAERFASPMIDEQPSPLDMGDSMLAPGMVDPVYAVPPAAGVTGVESEDPGTYVPRNV